MDLKIHANKKQSVYEAGERFYDMVCDVLVTRNGIEVAALCLISNVMDIKEIKK